LTAALYGNISLVNGAVQQSNFHDYPLLRLPETPAIEVAIIVSREEPSGVGEPGVPPLAAAVANAVFVATGQRLRQLRLQLSGYGAGILPGRCHYSAPCGQCPAGR